MMNLTLAMPKPRHEAAEATLEFGDFRVLVRQRRLLAGGMPVELGARAFDILMVLIEADGALVTKDELQRRVWGELFVSPDNLKVQIAALRKALGEDRGLILTDFGRGYRFTAEVRSTAEAPERFAPGVAPSLPPERPPWRAVVWGLPRLRGSEGWGRHPYGGVRSAHRIRRRQRTGSASRRTVWHRAAFNLAG